jgi:uncharacterized protein
MQQIKDRLAGIDWPSMTEQLDQKGFALASSVLTTEDCGQLIGGYDQSKYYRKTITMERYRFGLGEYKYFRYPLPPMIQTIREYIYTHLAPVANEWMKALNIATRFPLSFSGLQELCHTHNQIHPTVLILKYGKGGHNTLHQDLYGELFFPIQAVLFLNEPGKDYTGGEFVLTQQTPRAQSKAIVLQPKRGEPIVITG